MTIDEKKEIVAKVDSFRSGGLSIIKSCENVGVSDFSYYSYKREIEGKPPYRQSAKRKSYYVKVADRPTENTPVPVVSNKKVKSIEAENAQLKIMVADLMLALQSRGNQ